MTTQKKSFAAFYSYVRKNDIQDGGKLSQLRKQLGMEVWAQTGDDFEIFQDREDIHWGEAWKERIEKGLNDSTFLICIITPSFLKSQACRSEIENFLRREKELGRNDLIFPLLYIDTPDLKDKNDEVAVAISNHQWADWTDMRHESLSPAKAKKRLGNLAKQIVNAIRRTMESNNLSESLLKIPNSISTPTLLGKSLDDLLPDSPPDWEMYATPTGAIAPPVISLDDMLTLEKVADSQSKPKIEAQHLPFKPIAPIIESIFDDGTSPKLLTVFLRSSGDSDRDRRRIKNIYGILIAYPGNDHFQFQIFENGKGHLIDFPHDTIHITPEMLDRLKKLMGSESWRIEEITFQ